MLKAYLLKEGLKPDFILVFDDSTDNLESIVKMASELKIAILAYQFVPQAEGLTALTPEHIAAWRELIVRAKVIL